MASTAEEIPSDGGWQASLRLGFRTSARGTLLAERRRQGPLAVQRPFYPEGEVCHTYLLHPPGGVVGGDRLDIDVDLATGTQALIIEIGFLNLDRELLTNEADRVVEGLADGLACFLEGIP